jgi:hypothetical protein
MMRWERGPHALDHRAAEDDAGRAIADDLSALIIAFGSCSHNSGPPPPRLKGREAGGGGGVRNGLYRR